MCKLIMRNEAPKIKAKSWHRHHRQMEFSVSVVTQINQAAAAILNVFNASYRSILTNMMLRRFAEALSGSFIVAENRGN